MNKAYNNGANAFLSGKHESANPYSIFTVPEMRADWKEAFLKAKDIKKELETLAESGKEAFATGVLRMVEDCISFEEQETVLASAIDVSEKYAEDKT